MPKMQEHFSGLVPRLSTETTKAIRDPVRRFEHALLTFTNHQIKAHKLNETTLNTVIAI